MNKLIAFVLLAIVIIGCGPAPTPPSPNNLPPSFYESGTLSYRVTLPDHSTKTVSRVTNCEVAAGTWSQDKSVFVVQCKVYAYTVWAGLAVELEIVK